MGRNEITECKPMSSLITKFFDTLAADLRLCGTAEIFRGMMHIPSTVPLK